MKSHQTTLIQISGGFLFSVIVGAAVNWITKDFEFELWIRLGLVIGTGIAAIFLYVLVMLPAMIRWKMVEWHDPQIVADQFASPISLARVPPEIDPNVSSLLLRLAENVDALRFQWIANQPDSVFSTGVDPKLVWSFNEDFWEIHGEIMALSRDRKFADWDRSFRSLDRFNLKIHKQLKPLVDALPIEKTKTFIEAYDRAMKNIGNNLAALRAINGPEFDWKSPTIWSPSGPRPPTI